MSAKKTRKLEFSDASSAVKPGLLARPSLCTSLTDAFSRMFSFEKNGGLKSVFAFAVGLLTFSWFTDSLLLVVQELSLLLLGALRGGAPAQHLSEPLSKLLLPGLIFLLTASLLVVNAHRNSLPRRYGSAVPDPHKGLILQLSDYNPRGPGDHSRYASAEEIKSAAEARTLDLAEVFKSNWGQVAFAVRYHAPALSYCWVICTGGDRGSSKDFAAAESMIKAVVKSTSGRDVASFKVELKDENDIGHTAQNVSDIYHRLSDYESGLQSLDIIADFTGGTAAMSGGMILATLQEDREIEYLRRGMTLTVELDAAAVQNQRIIISPRTSRGMIELFARR